MAMVPLTTTEVGARKSERGVVGSDRSSDGGKDYYYRSILAVLIEATEMASNSSASFNKASSFAAGSIFDRTISSNQKSTSSASSSTVPILLMKSAALFARLAAR